MAMRTGGRRHPRSSLQTWSVRATRTLRSSFSGKIFDYELLSKNLNSRPKIKFLHGNIDEIVPVEEMYKAVDFLKLNKFNVDYKVYDNLNHAISPEGLSDGLNFIKKNI